MRFFVIASLIMLAACGNAATPPTSGVEPSPTAAVVETATVQSPAPTPTAEPEAPMPTPEPSHIPAVSATASVVVDPALMERARTQGSVRIIVMINIPWQPEGELPDEDAAVAQRKAIADAQRALLERLAAFNVTSVTTFEFIPSLAMEVDAPALEALAADPAVLTIQEDGLASPSGDTPSAPGLSGTQ